MLVLISGVSATSVIVWCSINATERKSLKNRCPMKRVSPGIRVQEVSSAKNNNLSHRGGHTHARDEIKSWLPIKYTANPCHITI
jgi:hypothetical protein